MVLEGSVIKYGDNVDTDLIIAARYLNTPDPKEYSVHCMEDLDATFIKRVKKGDIMVAGRNFGCGSSREHAPAALKEAGISCVVAKSFARIFYRNSINIGLPIMESIEAAEEINEGDILKVDLSSGVIENVTSGKKYSSEAFPEFIQKIISCGGLVNATDILSEANQHE